MLRGTTLAPALVAAAPPRARLVGRRRSTSLYSQREAAQAIEDVEVAQKLNGNGLAATNGHGSSTNSSINGSTNGSTNGTNGSTRGNGLDAAAYWVERVAAGSGHGASSSAAPSVADAAQPGSVLGAAPAPYALVESRALAGGTLNIVRLEGDRMLRVWMPPGYSREEAARWPFPILLLNDGQNVFEDALSFSGCSWRAGEAAAALITSGQLPPFLIAGIDHAGPDRSLELLPYKPGTGPGGFRKDGADWPGGGVAAYLDRVFGEMLPWLQREYGAATDPDRIAFGGSSFGGICTLWACMHHGDKFGVALVESPSFWFADERFLREDIPSYLGPWPQRLFLGMGSKEYSGIRPPGAAFPDSAKWDALLAGYGKQLAALLEERGVDASRLQWQIAEGATHTESAWAQRLPGALRFLLSPWWRDATARHADSLYFTSPRRLQAGQPAVLFVNAARSDTLAGRVGPLRLRGGFNGWTLKGLDLQFSPAPQLEGEVDRPAGAQRTHATWQSAAFTVPDNAYEMQFVLTDGAGSYDNNAGSDFYIRVAQPADGPVQCPQAALAVAQAAVAGPVDALAARSASKQYFTVPETLVAGAPAVLYFNRARSWALGNNPNIQAHLGFNHWEAGVCALQLAPSSLWRGEGVDWWATPTFQVPSEAFDVSFAFTDGHGTWDNNDGHNFSAPVWRPAAAKAGVAPRAIASTEMVDHAGGLLHVLTLAKRAATDKASKESRWKEEKVVRVWTPPGWSRDGAPPGGWPVLYMNDGGNMFEDWLAHQGSAWNVGYAAAHLIGSGVLPPFLVVAVDSAGPMRSLNYLPYKPGTGQGGFRGDAERWPGGGCEGYMRRLVTELMPLVADEFGTAADPARVAFGGGSFAGVTALYAALHYPHVFGSVLAESPSLWIAEGRFLGDLWEHKGALPERLFLGCGTKEYSATRDHERPEIDEMLLGHYHEAAKALEAAGMRGPQRLQLLVEEGAGHHEKAWAWRLSGALTFLLSPWWDEF